MPTASDLRTAVGDLTVLANNDLRAVWRQVSTADMARQALEEVLPPLVAAYGSAAGTVAADWYDELRDTERVPGRFRAVPAVSGPAGADVLARWGIDPLFRAEPDWDTARQLVAGGMQRRISDVARQTISGSSLADPSADGWQRTGSGECDFCEMLIARGAVYTEQTVQFASHDNCNCAAVPAFGGRPRPVNPYTPSSRNVTDADRARVREYLANNHAG